MSAEAIIADLIVALDLPASARVNQRVPKKLLTENGAPTAADKRAISDGIEELHWLAALKPNTIGVPDYRDEVREYLEIAVLHLTLRAGAKASRLVALAHRAVPYPVLLLAARADGASISAAHKRWSQGEAGKTVLDGDIVEANLGTTIDSDLASSFCNELALNRQPRLSLFALYQGWIDTLFAFQAACKTGRFVLADSSASAAARREALTTYARLELEIARLRTAAAKENQLPRRVELNLSVKSLQAALAAARAKL
jgi:hypothetical protein